MIPNINPKTGIAYGVISGNNVPELMSHIYEAGTPVFYTAYVDDLRVKIVELLEDRGLSDTALANVADDLLGTIMHAVAPEIDEESYDLEEDGFKYHMSYLGGAPLITVMESPYITYAYPCSPCVRNAGDLDTANSGGHLMCYCVAPEELEVDHRARMTIVLLQDIKDANEAARQHFLTYGEVGPDAL